MKGTAHEISIILFVKDKKRKEKILKHIRKENFTDYGPRTHKIGPFFTELVWDWAVPETSKILGPLIVDYFYSHLDGGLDFLIHLNGDNSINDQMRFYDQLEKEAPEFFEENTLRKYIATVDRRYAGYKNPLFRFILPILIKKENFVKSLSPKTLSTLAHSSNEVESFILNLVSGDPKLLHKLFHSKFWGMYRPELIQFIDIDKIKKRIITKYHDSLRKSDAEILGFLTLSPKELKYFAKSVFDERVYPGKFHGYSHNYDPDFELILARMMYESQPTNCVYFLTDMLENGESYLDLSGNVSRSKFYYKITSVSRGNFEGSFIFDPELMWEDDRDSSFDIFIEDIYPRHLINNIIWYMKEKDLMELLARNLLKHLYSKDEHLIPLLRRIRGSANRKKAKKFVKEKYYRYLSN